MGSQWLVAQSTPLERRWEANVMGGFLAPHRASIRALVSEHALGAGVTWSSPAEGLWSCSRMDPRWGFTAHYGKTGAPEYLGHQAALLGMADLRLTGQWRFRLCGGVGWTEKTWSAEDPTTRQRIIIGSPINGAVQIGLHLPPCRGAKKPGLDRIGFHLTLDHQSNGSFTQPNLGTNVFRLGMSTGWTDHRSLRTGDKDTILALSFIPPPVTGWQIQGGIGRRQPAPLDARETVQELSIDRRFRRGLRLGTMVGFMGMFRPAHSGMGVHAGFQIRFTRVQVDLLHGRYLLKWQEDEAHYNRVVFQWHVQGGLWARVALHTHGFRAHHPSLGVGYVLGGNRPYGKR